MDRNKLKDRVERVKSLDFYNLGETQAKKAIIEPILDTLD
jgi:hypothetical protein